MFNYDNIGDKIKSLAKFVFIAETICGALFGITMLLRGGKFIIFGLLSAFIIALIAWISSWLFYGFGELISLTAANYFALRNFTKGTPNSEKVTIDSLTRCPSCGKIGRINSQFCDGCGAPINNK